VQFAAGGPELPEDRTIASLASWTTFGGEAVQRFSGTAIYSTTLPALPAGAAAFEIDLGAVRDSARVLIDGREAATLLGPSFRLVLDRSQLKGESALAVHVTNLMANRIAAMDKAGVRWRKFYNVNFPSRLPQNRGPDGLFTAVKWEPLDSGLLGPVTVTPMQVR
jgi:hypothetical protein